MNVARALYFLEKLRATYLTCTSTRATALRGLCPWPRLRSAGKYFPSEETK